KKDMKLLLAVVLFVDLLMAGVFFIISPKDFVKTIPLLIALIIFIDFIFLLIILFSMRVAKKMDERWSALADKMGWQYSMNVEFVEPNGKSVRMPGLVGKYKGRLINITTFSMGENVQTMATTPLQKGLPEPLLITPSIGIPFLKRGEPVISKEFDKRYSVKSKDMEYAKRVVKSIQGKILSTPLLVSLQAGSNLAAVYTSGMISDEKKIIQLAELVVEFADAVERVRE
ncbi:MAG: hypothetical protein QXZ40_02000, partial [Candidatus Micrarchaeia archaeon]